MQSTANDHAWPELPLEAWSDSLTTLHLWTQIAGKIRLAQTPPVNHCWHVTLYVTPTGLTTSPIPYNTRTFQIDFDFIRHQLVIEASDGGMRCFPLKPQTVAAFYRMLMQELESLGFHIQIIKKPNEVADPIPFDHDEVHKSYDPEYVNRFWQILLQSDRIFKNFRSRFIGKCSPVHFFWGAPDLAVTRFSGRKAPQHPGGVLNLPDEVVRDAYSHEVSSLGFWAGSGAILYPAFYSYAVPEPDGFSSAQVKPAEAFYSSDMREFILSYDVVRKSGNPDQVLLDFSQSTYEAAASLGRWDRSALERKE
jgi:hypothetical protein